jgi:hypothetical protein
MTARTVTFVLYGGKTVTTINSDIARDMYYANLMYEIHKIKEKIRFFASKYSLSFDDFEKEVKRAAKEDFTKWDDYMEWKTYEKLLKKFYKEKRDLEVGNYKVS